MAARHRSVTSFLKPTMPKIRFQVLGWSKSGTSAHGRGYARNPASETHRHINKTRALRKMSADSPPVWNIADLGSGQAEKQQKSLFVLYFWAPVLPVTQRG